jgi:hypothetical protein
LGTPPHGIRAPCKNLRFSKAFYSDRGTFFVFDKEELDGIVSDIVKNPFFMGDVPLHQKLLHLYGVHPWLAARGGPELDYVLYKAGLTCPYFSADPWADDPFKRYCDDGFKAPANCTGLRPDTCSWHGTRRWVGELKEFLSEEQLGTYYRMWTDRIASGYTPERIVKHLENHSREERSREWYASTRNLVDIYERVEGADGKNPLFLEAKETLSGYKETITTEQQLLRLLKHYRKHLDVSTKMPLRGYWREQILDAIEAY